MKYFHKQAYNFTWVKCCVKEEPYAMGVEKLASSRGQERFPRRVIFELKSKGEFALCQRKKERTPSTNVLYQSARQAAETKNASALGAYRQEVGGRRA